VSPLRRAAICLTAVPLLGLLGGCAATVSMSSAAGANDPACAAVMVRLPDALDGQQRRWTDAQATGAWGSPETSVLLTCGLDAPGPSVLPCQSAGGVDWIIDDADAPSYRLTTYGRSPAVEVYLDSDRVSSRTVLEALGPAVRQLPAQGAACTERPTDGQQG